MTQNAQKIKSPNDNSKIKVDPTERSDFILALSIDDKLLDHDPKVASILFSFRNNKSGICNPAHKTIAERANMSVSKVRRSIERMAKAGWITITKRSTSRGGLQTSNQYDMDFKSACSAVSRLYDSKVPPARDSGTTGTRFRLGCSPVNSPGAQQWTARVLTSEQPGCSPVNNELRDINSEVEPGDSNPEKQDSRIATQRRNVCVPFRGKNGPSAQTGLFKNHKTVNHSKPDSCTDRMNQDLSFQRMLMASFQERDDQEFGTNSIRNAEKGARFRFDKLIRSGVHWRRIETAYANHLKIREDANQFSLPLVSFLSRNGEDISDPDCDLYVPPEVGNSDEPVLPEAGNDNQEPVRKRVSGSSDIDFEADPPF